MHYTGDRFLNPDFPLALVARVLKMLKMGEKKSKSFRGVVTLRRQNDFGFFSRRFSILSGRSRVLMENLG